MIEFKQTEETSEKSNQIIESILVASLPVLQYAPPDDDCSGSAVETGTCRSRETK